LPRPPVVVPTAQLAVVDGRHAACRPGLDVVALASVRGLVTAMVGTALIAHLGDTADGASEPAGPAQVDDTGRPVEHDPLDQGLVQEGRPSRG
jgi:hypothetical protein